MQIMASRGRVAQVTCTRHQLLPPSGKPIRLVSAKSGNLDFPDTFKEALQTALGRSQDGVDSSGGRFAGYSSSSDSGSTRSSSSRGDGSSSSSSSRGDGSSSSLSRAAPGPEAGRAASEFSPLVQVLATALGQSRGTLERLQAEEAEIENLIQRERKQVERLEWLLEKVQMDYAYFNQLQKRFDQEHGSASNRW